MSFLMSAAVWISRATGIGYRSYPPLAAVIEESEFSVKREIATRAERIVKQLEEIEHYLMARDERH